MKFRLFCSLTPSSPMGHKNAIWTNQNDCNSKINKEEIKLNIFFFLNMLFSPLEVSQKTVGKEET